MSTNDAPIRWGIIGTAKINLKLLAGAKASGIAVTAVASRDADKARAYAAEQGIPTAHGSYEALLADPAVDAVYISLPNHLHHPVTMQALAAGKHVLCEKPYTRRPDEVDEAWDAADRAGLVLQEAFMWRHSQQTRRMLELLPRIGPLTAIRATFAFPLQDPTNVRLGADLDGGSLMDVGCYTVSASRLVAGEEPDRVHGEQLVGPTGVDIRFGGLLHFPRDINALIMSAFTTDHESLEVIGANGSLFLRDPWHCRSGVIKVRLIGQDEETVTVPFKNPYGCELEDMEAAIRGHDRPLLGREDALGQARTIAGLYRSAETGQTVTLD
ncbi:MAG: Gfo/Idh/MocA family oxidoreductase [Chloroflexota bacterium]